MLKLKCFVGVVLLVGLSWQTHAQVQQAQVDHYAILVSNLEVSCQFYQTILGLQEIEDQTQQDHIRWFSMGKRGTELHIIEQANYTIPNEKGVHLAFRVKDLDAFVKHLTTKKVAFQNWMGEANTTNTRPDGIRQVYFTDPDGYWIEVNGK